MRGSLCLLLVCAALSASCSTPKVDLAKGLQLTDGLTGWEDSGIVNGQNKLSPSISFKLKNVSDQTLGSLQLNAIFRQITEKDEWGASFLPAVGSEGLAPGASTATIRIVSPHGYTGSESREDIMKNSRFIDAKVEVFAKYGSVQWTRLGEFRVVRQLLK